MDGFGDIPVLKMSDQGVMGMITVKEFQQAVSEDKVTIIAGFGGLEKKIEHLIVQEFSFKSSRVMGESAVLTTLYGFKNLDEIIEHFKWYIEIGVSAVCVHKVVYPEIPKEILELADQANLPLLYIPNELSYQLLYKRFNDLHYQEATKLKREIDELNQSMLDALLLEKDMHFIIQSIGKYFDEPIVYLDSGMDILALWNSGSFSRTGLRDWLEKVVGTYAETFREVRATMLPFEIQFAEPNRQLSSVLIVPLNSKLDYYGYLIIGQHNKKSPFRDIIIKNAATVLVLDAMKKNETKEYHKNRDIRILEKIFEGSRAEEVADSDFYHDIRNVNSLVMVEPEDKTKLREAYQLICQKIEGSNELIWIKDNKILALVQLEFGEGKAVTLSADDRRMGLSSKLTAFTNEGFRMLYEQAEISLHFAKLKQRPFCSWRDLGTEKIIYFMKKSNSLKDFHMDYLQQLVDYDKENDTTLVDTLHVYLESFFSLKESGEKLHLHPNTVKYRIKKIEDLLGRKIDDPAHYLELMMALKSYSYSDQP